MTADATSQRLRVRRGVIGIIERPPREFLVIRRADGVAKPGYWCFPGGHLEPGENGRRAVQRELAEELGIEVAPLSRLGSVRVKDSNHILAVWRVRHVHGVLRPAPAEIAEIRWLSAAGIRMVSPALASNHRVLEMLGV